tara:strand:+ start:3038 stop:3910 length:873 start_codon:yes stop_codon:yes gene_type:complete
MKQILITGGLGFIGASLARNLITDGKEVTIVDNLSNNTVDNVGGATLYLEDVSSFFEKNHKSNDFKFDTIFHFGEYSRVETSFKDEEGVFKNNRNSFYSVLNYVKKSKAKLIYSASSTLFGDNGSNRFLTPYAFTKYQNVEFLKVYGDWYNLNYAICYFYNVYGCGENSDEEMGTVIAKFLRYKGEGREYLPVNSPGTQKRNFTHINDTVNALKLIGKRGQGDGYGIGNEKKYSILEIVSLLECKPTLMPEVRGNRLDGELLTEKTLSLGWAPQFQLDQYLSEELEKLRS